MDPLPNANANAETESDIMNANAKSSAYIVWRQAARVTNASSTCLYREEEL